MLRDKQEGIIAVVVGTESTFELVGSVVRAATSWEMLERTLPKDCKLINIEFAITIAKYWVEDNVHPLRGSFVKKSVGKTKPTSKMQCIFQLYNNNKGIIAVVIGPASSSWKVMKAFDKAEKTSPRAVWGNFVENLPKGCDAISLEWDSELAVPW